MTLDIPTVLALVGPVVTSASVISTLRGDMSALRTIVADLRASIDKMSHQIAEAMRSVAVHDARFEAIDGRVTALEIEMRSMRDGGAPRSVLRATTGNHNTG